MSKGSLESKLSSAFSKAALDTGEKLPKINAPLGKRLLKYILLFSGSFTLVTMMYSYFLDYNAEMDLVEEKFSQFEKSTVPALAGALWEMNTQQAEETLKGAIQVSDVHSLQIFDEGSNLLLEQTSSLASSEYLVEKQFNISRADISDGQKLGVLKVNITKFGILKRIRDRAFVFFLSQGIKTLFVSLAILQIFYLLVARHVVEISRRLVRDDDLSSFQENPIVIRKKAGKVDEIDILVQSMEKLALKVRDQSAKISGMLTAAQEEIRDQTQELRERHFQTELLAEMNNEISQRHQLDRTLRIACEY